MYLYVRVCIRFPCSPTSSIRTIRRRRQRRRSFKECVATSSRRSGLPYGISDRSLPLRWTTLALAPRGDLNRPFRSMCPTNSESLGWLPRALPCRATPARSAYSQTHTRAPTHLAGPLLRPTPFPSSPACQALRRSSPYVRLSYFVKIESSRLQAVISSMTCASVGLPMYEWHFAHRLYPWVDHDSPHVPQLPY